MALRFSAPGGGRPSPRLSEVPVLSPSEKPQSSVVARSPVGLGPKEPANLDDLASESMGSLGTRFAKQGDVSDVCKALEATAGDVWLVDSGATCHIVSTQHLSGFRVVKKHERTANLFNASGGSIVVSGVVDLEVHFGDVFLRLEEVLVAEVGFNVISPWTASERGWKTFLAKGGSRLYKGNKKSIKLVGAQRAWWAVSGSKKNPKRQPKGAVPMEIDSISEGPKPGRCAGTALPGPALTGLAAPPGILKNRRKEAEVEIEAPGARNPLSGTPFSFLFRGFVSDVSVLGPSGAPVFRDEAPEVREDSLGDPSLLRKEHDLEVVEHDCAHEFSEVCSDFEFFPEKPKAFRKLWHGVSMYELVRKPCSLNFGMLGLFGMIGMTLLLAAVFAFGAFCGKGNDGQLVACGGSWGTGCSRAESWCSEFDRAGSWCSEFGRAGSWCSEFGRAGSWCSEFGRAGSWCSEFGRAGSWCSEFGRAGSECTACAGAGEWRDERGRAGGWYNQWARGVVSGGSWGLRCPCCQPGDPSECAITWFRTLPPSGGFSCSRGFGPACCYRRRRRRCLGTLASTALGGGRWSSRASWWCYPGGGEIKRPRRGLPSGSQVQLSVVPLPGEAEEKLLRQVFMREQERRIQEGLSLGMRLQAAEDEPLPMLSHFYGRPSSTESMYDSLSLALTDRGFLTRVALGGGSQDVPGGATGISGKGRLDRPEEFAEETPYMPPRLPRYPEQEQQRPQPKLMIDAATITDNALDEWSAWLKLAQQGRSLREWGILSSDIVTAVQYLGEAPPEEPAATTRGGRWSNAPRGGRRKQQQDYPTSVGVLLYLKKALKCIDCFDRAPSGYHGLLLGPSSAMALERPDGGTASDEREAWKFIAASIAVRVQRLLDKKRVKNRAVTEMTAIYLQTPKATARPRPVQSPTTPAEDSSSSSDVSEVSGESLLEGEGVGEAIGVIRSCQDKGESLWTPGVVCRLFGTPEFPHKVFPEAAAAMAEKAAAAAPEATAIDPSGAAASSDTAAGTAAAVSAMAPPTPAATEPKSPQSLASVIYRPGRLVEKTLMASDGSTVPKPPGIPPRHVLPQPLPPPSQSSPAQNLGQTCAEREFVLPKPAPLGASSSGTQFEDYESVVEAARAAIESASQQL